MVIKGFFIFISLILFTAQSAYATTYYIDSEHGNDSWSGKISAPLGNSSVDGPWQTLGRLAAAPLLPNDVVFLACGGNWNETLRIPSSGTSGNPIVISAGPNHCETRPTIDGAVTIPGHMWTRHSGAIYRARLPIEYINNPGVSENLSGWNIWSQVNDASMSLDTACSGSPLPCMQFTSGTGVGESLVISNNFPIGGGLDYSASVLVKAPAGTRLKFVIRRGGPTYESLAVDQSVTASGGWQTVSFAFRAARSAPNARFDIEVPNGKVRINLREAHVQRGLPASGVTGVFVDSAAVRRAHHPNFGRAGADPNSPYGTIASASGNRTLDTAGLTLPSNASPTPGLGVSIRLNNFALDERKIASLQGTRLVLDQDTSYPITAGYGFFLTGALWMLDSPGEWYFDSSTKDLYVWMPEGNAPGSRVSFNSLAFGADLRSKAYIDLVGLDIRRVGTGVQLRTANTVRLRDVTIAEIADYGVEADDSSACAVEQSNITNTGLDAIKAVGEATTGFTVSDSRVTDSGTLDRTDSWRKLPRPGLAAINVGPNARILRNQVLGAAHNGMFLEHNSTVENNHVSRPCTISNDCGGIVSNYVSTGTSIAGNVIDTITGGLAGLPANAFSQTAGIYLDDRSVDIQVRGNTVTGADYGVQVHDAYNSTVSGNLLFGNRRYQLWFQEQTAKLRANGDIYGNRVESNLMVPVAGGPSVFMESEVGDTDDFAIFSNNHYSALISPRPVGERWPTGSSSYTLSEWQAARQDTGGRVTQPAGYAPFLSNGTNIVPNGNLANNITKWTWWNSTAPYAQPVLLSCSFGPCLQLTAGATSSLLASPNFSVIGGQWYRVSFDAATSGEGQRINLVVRRGGGGSAGYENLVPTVESLSGSTTWRRYSFVFQAVKTVIANDPATGERGARLDFEDIQPGSSLTVATLEIVPLTRSQAAMQLRLQVNPSGSNISIPCSPDDEAGNLCDKFVHIKDDSALDWSSLVPAYSGNAIYTRDMTLVDTDHDSVADTEDICPKTPAGVAVNARGCGFDDR